jgi:hypothetical protein
LKAGELVGVQSRTRLSMLAKMTSREAKSMANDPARIKQVEEHFLAVLKDFGKNVSGKSSTTVMFLSM